MGRVNEAKRYVRDPQQPHSNDAFKGKFYRKNVLTPVGFFLPLGTTARIMATFFFEPLGYFINTISIRIAHPFFLVFFSLSERKK